METARLGVVEPAGLGVEVLVSHTMLHSVHIHTIAQQTKRLSVAFMVVELVLATMPLPVMHTMPLPVMHTMLQFAMLTILVTVMDSTILQTVVHGQQTIALATTMQILQYIQVEHTTILLDHILLVAPVTHNIYVLFSQLQIA